MESREKLLERFTSYRFPEPVVQDVDAFYTAKEVYFESWSQQDYDTMKVLYFRIDETVKEFWQSGKLTYDEFYEFRRVLREDLY